MEELIVHLEFAKILALLSLGTVIITIIAFLLAKENRIIKYIPGILLIIFGLYNLIYLGEDLLSSTEFNRLYMVVIGMICGIIGLFTGLIIGVITKTKN